MALSWYLTTEARQLLALAERAVEVYGKLFDLAKIRQAAGKGSELDVVDARARLETAQSELEAARNTYGRARRALEMLLGRYPAAEIETAAVSSSAAAGRRRGACIAAGTAARPRRGRASGAGGVPAGRGGPVALLPDFSISLVGERLGDHLIRQLQLSPWLASAAIGMAIPIYEGGALRAQVKIATAQQAQAVASYGSVVLNAFREVEDVLASEQILEKRLGYEQRALVDRNAAVQLAVVQYQAGRRDLLWVEQLQSEQIVVESNVIQLRNAQIANRIQLHLALGGSFDVASSVAELAGGKYLALDASSKHWAECQTHSLPMAGLFVWSTLWETRHRPSGAARRGGREPRNPTPSLDFAGHDSGVVRDRVRLSPHHGSANSAGNKDGGGGRRHDDTLKRWALAVKCVSDNPHPGVNPETMSL